ncbi:MAG TPA: hypothetical protein VHW09_01020 [Bryobacteraceae bacterium]|jgi:hypothetical protein|nr:hypothetical protein [Bryobacteraceae bacterium]
MGTTDARKRGAYCHRCLEPAPPKATRCPLCGEPIHRPANIRKILAIFGLLVFVAIVAVSIRMIHSSPPPPDAAGEPDIVRPGAPDKPPADQVKPALGQ